MGKRGKPKPVFYLTHLDENTKGGMRYIAKVNVIILSSRCNVLRWGIALRGTARIGDAGQS